MSTQPWEKNTPSLAYRRELFNPELPRETTDEHLAFDALPAADEVTAEDGALPTDEISLESHRVDEPPRRVFTGLLALGAVAGGGTLAALAMLGLMLAALWAFNADVAPTKANVGDTPAAHLDR